MKLRDYFLLMGFLFLVTLSCSTRGYPDVDARLLAYQSEIDDAEKDLETGRYCFKIYDYRQAERFFNQAVLKSKKVSYQQGHLYGLNDLGLLNTERGFFPSAVSNFKEALPLSQKLQIPQAESDVLNNMALLVLVSGNDYFGEPVPLLLEKALKKNRLPLKGLVIQANLGLYHLSKNDYTKAATCFNKVRKEALKKDYYELLVRSTLRLGQASLQKGEVVKGIAYAKDAFNIASSWDDKRGLIDVSDLLSLYYEKNGDIENALIYAKVIYNIRKGLLAKDFEKADLARIARLEGK